MARSRLISKVSEMDLAHKARVRENAHTFIHLDVDGTPPDVIFAGVFVNNTLVFGTTTSLLSGEVDQSTGRGYNGAFIPNSILVKKGNRSITLDLDAIHIESGLGEVLEILANDCRAI